MCDIEAHRKRVYMRATHRGIKEMDIILGRYANAKLAKMSKDHLTHFENFMDQNDQYLYALILGNEDVDEQYLDLVEDIRKNSHLF